MISNLLIKSDQGLSNASQRHFALLPQISSLIVGVAIVKVQLDIFPIVYFLREMFA